MSRPADHGSRLERTRLSLDGLSLGDAFGERFFQPTALYNTDEGGLDPFLRGIVEQRSERCDRYLPFQVTDKLVLPGQSHTNDLFSLNTRRGRDHGLPGQ